MTVQQKNFLRAIASDCEGWIEGEIELPAEEMFYGFKILLRGILEEQERKEEKSNADCSPKDNEPA